MRIVQLNASNLKKLTAIEIKPDGSIIEVRGKNAAGKSSVLDAVSYALGGKRLCPTKPIRDGEQKAEVEVDLGDIKVKRTWTLSGSYLSVSDARGMAVKSPQAVLDKMVGALTFDPLAFSALDPSAQRSTLFDLIGVQTTLDDLERQESEQRNRRYEAKKARDRKISEANALDVPDGTPDEPVSISALMDKLTSANEEIARNAEKRRVPCAVKEKLDQRQQDLQRAEEEVDRLKAEVARFEGHAKSAKADIIDMEKTLSKARADVENIADPDIDVIKQEIESAQSVNEAVSRKKSRADAISAAHDEEKAVIEADAALKSISASRVSLLKSAKWPIDGLSYVEGELRFGSVPLSQCSSAEKLRVSVAIGMALNPKLRVLLVRDGSLLDDESLAALYESIEDHDYQLWIERVGEGGGKAEVVIENGSVKDDK